MTRPRLALIAFWSLWLFVAAVAADAQPRGSKRILLLHQAAVGEPIRARFDAAFVEAIRAAGSVQIDLYEETIEAARFPGADQSQLLVDFMRRKYAGRPIDVIVAQGMVPLTFARQNRTLFGNPPIVTVISPAGQIAPAEGVTGLQGGFFIGGTIDLALALLPDIQSVFVVDGARENSDALQREIERQVQGRVPRLRLVYLRDLALRDVLSRIAAIPAHSVVLFIKQSMRNSAEDLDQFEGLDQVLRASPVPVFTQLEEFVGSGVVGGYVWRFEVDATRIAAMAIEIANGRNVRDMPAGVATYNAILDWRQLQRWRIPIGRVPADTVVRFRQLSFFEQYRRYVLSAFVVFAVQLALIAGLLVQRIWRRRAEARTNAILRAIPDLMFIVSRDGTYLDYHARDSSPLFEPASRLIGRNLRDVTPEPLVSLLLDAIERACTIHGPVIVECDLSIGELRQFEVRLVHAGGDRVLIIMRDVTDSKRATELNRHLVGRLIASQEMERQRIARELHDDLSQKVALLNMDIDQVAAASGDNHRLQLHTIARRIGEIASDVHNLSHELHPAKLQTVGLVAAMEGLCRDISQQYDIDVAFSHDMRPPGVASNVSLCVYRITQEALHNVAKHSRARDARVRLTRDETKIYLRITDSGIGFDADDDDHHAGLGLVSMRERAEFLNGHLTIHASRDLGTTIDVWVPLTTQAALQTHPNTKSA
jgi:signal transduction histidine kinase/ABC-type uncharacterized transport system substrate-binding protein